MIKQELLISRINLLLEKEVSSLSDTVTYMVNIKNSYSMPECPHCGTGAIIRYGSKCRKQRFFCKVCGCIFVSTTKTVMANLHFPAAVWKEVAKDTLYGQTIECTAKHLGMYH